MAAKKVVKKLKAPAPSTIDDIVFELDEHVDLHCEELEEHETRIVNLEEDLTGRDKVIWAILDQHNARIAALKFAFNPLPPDEVTPEGEVILANGHDDAGTPLWSTILFGFGLAAIGIILFLLLQYSKT